MRLFLTSNAFPATSKNLRMEFLKLVGKEQKDIKLAFIPTASVVEQDRSFMSIDRRELTGMGIPPEQITDLELDHHIIFEDLKASDVVFVDGGNTFYLLQQVRKSGFDTAIKRYLKEDCGVYVGVSAGTILAGPDIEISEPWDDKTKAVLTNTKGLALVPVAYSPHFKEEERVVIEEYKREVSYPIKELRDGQAIVVSGDEQRLIEG